jgi:hypothetical protein
MKNKIILRFYGNITIFCSLIAMVVSNHYYGENLSIQLIIGIITSAFLFAIGVIMLIKGVEHE